MNEDSIGKIVWRPNHFPNYFEEGISHDLLWVLGGSFEFNEEFVESQIKKNLPEGREFLWGTTPSHGRSVPNLAHCHIFSRVPPKSE